MGENNHERDYTRRRTWDTALSYHPRRQQTAPAEKLRKVPDGSPAGAEWGPVKIERTALPGVIEIAPDVFSDKRGFLTETYHQKRYIDSGIRYTFVQDNLSLSVRHTLRGLHYQHPHSQAKLVQALQGEIFDVVVDVRRGSPCFGRWLGTHLSEQKRHQLFVPEGFAHGFCVLSETALVYYKCSDFYSPESEKGILWSDPDLSIDWPVNMPVISEKDSRYPFLKDLPAERLPVYEENR
jgi:dTDP-4-dehydrorhamnose 3,5-epimerase